MIITGGENGYPREVEEVLDCRTEIQECAVIGLPDPEWGERVAAFIVLKPGFPQVPPDLKACLKTRSASFKVPKESIVVRSCLKARPEKY